MITHTKIEKFISLEPTVVTLGTFDGVHLGHKKILKKLVDVATQDHLQSVVLTFFPHPRMVLQQDDSLKLLNTIEERKKLLCKTGLHHLIIHPFNKKFSRLTALEFVKEVLVNQLKVKKIIIGYDHRFGRNRTATVADLREYGDTYGFTVEEIAAREIDEISISSTKIREALLKGDITTANTYLGYTYNLSGIVVKGKTMGKQLGFPTANIEVDEHYKLIPKSGSYIVRSIIDNQEVFGMLNIGYNPTFNGEKQTIEVYFLNFDKNLYNKKITIEFLEFLRDEQKFTSIKALQEQLMRDKNYTTSRVANNYK